MTSDEFTSWIEWLEIRWPGSRAYNKADAVYADFVPYSEQAMADVCRSLYFAKRRLPPSFSEIIGELKEMHKPGPVDLAECRHPRWGVLPDREATKPGHRVKVCVVCHYEMEVPRSLALTLTET